MRKEIGSFLQYMRVERGASDHTLKSYREDLSALAEGVICGLGPTGYRLALQFAIQQLSRPASSA